MARSGTMRRGIVSSSRLHPFALFWPVDILRHTSETCSTAWNANLQVSGWDNAWWDGAIIMAQMGYQGPIVDYNPAFYHFLSVFARRWAYGEGPIECAPSRVSAHCSPARLSTHVGMLSSQSGHS